MDRKRMLICAAFSGLGAILLFFGSQRGVAKADVVGPSLPLPDLGTWTAGIVVLVCVVAVAAVAVGIFFIWRARAKRRTQGPGARR